MQAALQLSYGSVLRREHTVQEAVSLHRSPAHATTSLSTSGMMLRLPSSPRFGGDSFAAPVSASLVGVDYGLMAWTITLLYDMSLLSLQSYTVDAIWGDATATEESGSLRLLMNCAADCVATNDAVAGLDIPIVVATFVVVPGAEFVGSHADAVSLRVNSMLNFGNAFILDDEADALVLDGRDGGPHASGTLEVESAAVVSVAHVSRC